MEEKVNIQPDEGCGGCSGCGSGGGCSKAGGCGSCGGCDIRSKLHSFNYFEDIPGGYADDDMVEVQFKNTRKGFYVNSTGLPLEIGDMVAVEAAPGHDIGRVSLTGALVRLQMRKAGIKPDAEKKRVFRKAKASDLERFEKAKALENDTMIRARKIASSLQLNMKIGDVEYQGDGNKAIFYYIADERVDFRQLIKVLAETFKVRIEMKQIGARQEAGRIGGIGPCGRPLCCTTWMSNFVSVSTGAARYQDISLNPQKLAGQCAKLKCCLNFEVDSYVEAAKKLPPKDVRLETADNTYYYFKADIFKGEITYSTDKHVPANLVTLTAAEAWDMIARNKAGEKPLTLKEENEKEKKPSEYSDILGQDSLTRFDKKKKKNRSGSQRRKDGKDPKESNSKDPKNAKDSKASKDPKDLKDSKEPKAPKAPKPQQPQREGGEKREQRQGRRGRDGRRPDRQANKPQGSNIQGDNQQPNDPQK